MSFNFLSGRILLYYETSLYVDIFLLVFHFLLTVHTHTFPNHCMYTSRAHAECVYVVLEKVGTRLIEAVTLLVQAKVNSL